VSLRRQPIKNSFKPREWSVYILRCADYTLYTGIAKNVEARIQAHNLGRGAAYTRGRGPMLLLREEPKMTHSQALIREAQIKKLSRVEKEELISAPRRKRQRPKKRSRPIPKGLRPESMAGLRPL